MKRVQVSVFFITMKIIFYPSTDPAMTPHSPLSSTLLDSTCIFRSDHQRCKILSTNSKYNSILSSRSTRHTKIDPQSIQGQHSNSMKGYRGCHDKKVVTNQLICSTMISAKYRHAMKTLNYYDLTKHFITSQV